VSELIDLTAAQAAERINAGEINAGELFEAYRARAAADELNAFTWVAEGVPESNGIAPLGGVPIAVKDLFCTQGVPSQSGSRILEGYKPPYTATVVEKLSRARTRGSAPCSTRGTAPACPAVRPAGAPPP
jgi:aspartyl-tRNA(Asn)/glutamyl-tRNA(Gln) amidotransferase subunit A